MSNAYDSLSPEQCQRIAEAEIFVGLISPAWLTDLIAHAELCYAKALRKPIRCLFIKGAQTIPASLREDIADYAEAHVSSIEEAVACIQAWQERR